MGARELPSRLLARAAGRHRSHDRGRRVVLTRCVPGVVFAGAAEKKRQQRCQTRDVFTPNHASNPGQTFPSWKRPSRNRSDHAGSPLWPPESRLYSGHMGDYDTAVSDNTFVYRSWFDGRNTCTNVGVTRHQADIRSIIVSWPP